MSGRETRKVRQGPVDVDYDESTLIVNYEVEVVQVDEGGRVIEVKDRIPESRKIKVKNLSPDKNLAQLAADIVERCKYIHPSRVEEIEQLLIKLRKHVLSKPATAATAAAAAGAGGDAKGPPQRIERAFEDPPPRDRGDRTKDKDRDRDIGQNRDRDGGRSRGDAAGGGRERGGGGGGGGGGGRDRRGSDGDVGGSAPSRGGDQEQEGDAERAKTVDEDELLPPASMDELENYLDMLYQVSGTSSSSSSGGKKGKEKGNRDDGLEAQIHGTTMIRKLCRVVMNLEQLIQNNTVMGAMTRVLQEEFKKSSELTFNILRVFLAFSNFMEMHGLMANYRIGVLTMKAIEYEIKRTELREAERRDMEATFEDDISAAKDGDLPVGADGKPQTLQQVLERVKKEREKMANKHKKQQKKQDKLLFVGFYILINLAEDVVVERKMIKKDLIDMLLSMLERSFADLLVLIVTFLKKMSIYDENKEALKDTAVIAKVVRFVPCSSQQLVVASLRLLFNLSFDADFREQMVKCGLVPKLIALLRTPALRARTLKLLYHLSADDRCKSMITYTDGIPLLMGMVINFPQNLLAKELAALMVNISHNNRNVEIMVSNRGLNYLMDRLGNSRDPLLLKIIRNIALWSFSQQQELESPELQYKYRGLWSPHLKLLMQLATCDNHDILVEVFGILANMTIYDLPSTSSWSKLIKEYNLMSLLSKLLVPGMSQPDLQLEIVMLVSAMASDGAACQLLASSNIIGSLYQLWKDKSDDSEILLQLIHCFYKLFQNELSREEAMYSTRIVVDIIDCLSHRNNAVRQEADLVTELVLEYDRRPTGELGQLGMQIRRKRFESYNQAWLQGVGQEISGPGAGDDDMVSSLMTMGPGGMGNMGLGNIGMGGGMGFDDYQDRDNMVVSARTGLSEDKMDSARTTDWRSMMQQRENLALGLTANDEEHEDPLIAARRSYEAASRARAKRNNNSSSQEKLVLTNAAQNNTNIRAEYTNGSPRSPRGGDAGAKSSYDTARSDSSRDSGHDQRPDSWMQSNYYAQTK